MAVVSFPSEPSVYTPSDNPIIWTILFPMLNAYKLYFKVTIQIEGVDIATLNIDQERSDGTDYYAHVDVSNIVKTYIDKPLVAQTTIVSDANNYKGVRIYAYAYYSSTENGDVVLDSGSFAFTNTVQVFKGRLSNKEFINWNYGDYLIGGSTRKFLTDNTNNIELREGDETFLQIIRDTVSTYALIRLYNSAGTLINNAVVAVSVGKITQFKISTTTLLDEFTLLEVADTSYLTINMQSGGAYSETKRININREGCYQGKNVVWLNKFGSYDSFLFTYNTILKSDVQSKSYGKQFGSWNGTTYVLDTKDTGSLTYLKTITDKVQIVSDWLTESVQNWLVSVYDSPLVYINEATTYENIEIENSTYAIKQMEHEELFNEILECKFTHTRNSVIL